MRAGDLRKRVKIQRRDTTALDDYGQPANAWVDVATCWAAIEPLSGNERLHAMQVNSEINSKVTVRYQSIWIDPKNVDNWRVLYGSRMLNINAMLNVDERNREVTLLVSEGINDGQ